MNQITNTLVTVAIAIIGLATVAVIVSKKAQTATVINSIGNVFTSSLKTVVSPIT